MALTRIGDHPNDDLSRAELGVGVDCLFDGSCPSRPGAGHQPPTVRAPRGHRPDFLLNHHGLASSSWSRGVGEGASGRSRDRPRRALGRPLVASGTVRCQLRPSLQLPWYCSAGTCGWPAGVGIGQGAEVWLPVSDWQVQVLIHCWPRARPVHLRWYAEFAPAGVLGVRALPSDSTDRA